MLHASSYLPLQQPSPQQLAVAMTTQKQSQSVWPVNAILKQGDMVTWMAKIVGYGSDVAGQQGDGVHNAQVSQTSRVTDKHVGHLQHRCGMCPAIKDN